MVYEDDTFENDNTEQLHYNLPEKKKRKTHVYITNMNFSLTAEGVVIIVTIK